MQTLLGYLQ